MKRVLHILRDPALDGPTNMARDEHLLHSDVLRPAVVRIYGWTPPTLSLGYFQRYADVARQPADVRDLPVVRRLTGGGAILHDREVTYGLVLDHSVPAAVQAPVALYRLVHECWRDALVVRHVSVFGEHRRPAGAKLGKTRGLTRRISGDGLPVCDGPRPELAPDDYPMPTPRTGPFFCFQKPGRTDLIIGPDKLLGSAQRRTPGRVLQHGSLLLGRRFASHPGADLREPPVEVVAGWIEAFLERLAAALGLAGQATDWNVEQLTDVAQRRERYASSRWTQRR